MLTLLLPKMVKTIHRKVCHSYYWHFESKSDQRFELEDVALDTYDLLHRINSNLLRMIELDRSLSSATELASSREMRTCRRLLKKIQELSGVDNSALMGQQCDLNK